jgi:uncharacterized membrane protein
MTWRQRYRVRLFLRSSLWPFPFVCIVAAIPAAHLVRWLDRQTGWTLDISAEAARAVVGSLTGALLTFVVFVFSVLLVALQLASVQLTPRVTVRIFMDPVTKNSLAIFTFYYTYSLTVLANLKDPVPGLSGMFCAYGSLACLALFVFLINHIGRELRPARVLTGVAVEARLVIRDVYPQPLATDLPVPPPVENPAFTQPFRVVEHHGAPGYVLAFDDRGLLKLACQADCIIEMVPQVGDFVATDDPLFRIHAGGQTLDALALRESIALGAERTLQQDPAFAFRIIVDIASKGLSPGINDPTTAVLAIDQVHHLLGEVGRRRLDTGQVYDSDNKLRLVYRTPDWEDFVCLAVTEIRHFGGHSIQIARRLRAMLESLIRNLPPERTVLLQRELSLIERQVERAYSDPEDRTFAGTADLQGVGGAAHDRGRRSS